MPGLIKIGMTTDHPQTRMLQLSSLTSVPTEFTCVWYAFSSNPSRDERELHGILKNYRLARNREFFRCTPDYAKSAAASIGLTFFDQRPPAQSHHTLGYENSEWIGAIGFFVLFLITLPVWNSDLTWYYKPLINIVGPVVCGVGLQIYLAFRTSP